MINELIGKTTLEPKSCKPQHILFIHYRSKEPRDYGSSPSENYLIIHQLQDNRTAGTIISSHIISSPIPYRTVERREHSFLHTPFLLVSMIGLQDFGSNLSVRGYTNLV